MLKLTPQPVKYRGSISGLRISSVDGTAFVDNLSGTLELANSPLLHTGTLTRANCRISAVAGTSFIDTDDATFATNLAAHLGKYLVIKDSAGKKAYAWIKAVGEGAAGGTTGDELITNGDFATGDGTGWTEGGSGAATEDYTGNELTSTITSAGSKTYNQTMSHPLKLLKASVTVRDYSGYLYGGFQMYPGYVMFILIPGNGTHTGYGTGVVGMTNVNVGTAGSIPIGSVCTFDDISLKQVTIPSPNGVTLTSTKGGTAMDAWESVESGFNYNDATGYTYYIYGRDIMDLADGNHLLEIYDSTGKVLKGYQSSVGDGEDLGAEINTGTLTALTLYKITATEVNHFGTGLEVDEYFTSAGTETCDANNKVKAVGGGTTAGVVLVSTKGGAVQNFAHKNASFTYNAASYQVIVRKAR